MERIWSCGQSSYSFRYFFGLGVFFWKSDTQTGHFPYTAQNATCALLLSVITNDSMLASTPIVHSFRNAFMMKRTLTECPWTLPETCPYKFYAVTCVWIQCFSPHGALHTADRFQAFVLLSFVFSSYIEPSLISTNHYFSCFFALKTQITSWNNSVETTNKIQLCNRIYYSTVH